MNLPEPDQLTPERAEGNEADYQGQTDDREEEQGAGPDNRWA